MGSDTPLSEPKVAQEFGIFNRTPWSMQHKLVQHPDSACFCITRPDAWETILQPSPLPRAPQHQLHFLY